MYLKRNIDIELQIWKDQKKRKPLLIRGARQVGKTASIRNLGEKFDYYLEINFEESKQVHKIFEMDLSPNRILEELSILFNVSLTSGKCLLFFDEIQACIPAIQSLRFFYEQKPNLHVVAAGSLLEFALQEISSFGVGRIQSLFMYPFSFTEFLFNLKEQKLLSKLQQATPYNALSDVLHEKLIKYLKRYIILGGMPEIMALYISTGDMLACRNVLDDLIRTLQDDFKKYKKHISSSLMTEVFLSVIRQTGGKFIYSKASSETRHHSIKEALKLLQSAGLVIPVTHTHANGIPLGAELNPKKQKMLLFDTGIFLRLLNFDISDILLSDQFDLLNKGAVMELFVGLEMMKAMPMRNQNPLYYWHREARNSNAEVDYVIQKGTQILPIEVKASHSGKMQSMFLFLSSKNLKKGVRISLENFSSYENIEVYPLYAVENVFKT